MVKVYTILILSQFLFPKKINKISKRSLSQLIAHPNTLHISPENSTLGSLLTAVHQKKPMVSASPDAFDFELCLEGD